jgi:hypothetical protein
MNTLKNVYIGKIMLILGLDLDPDPHLSKSLDQDLDPLIINANPKHRFQAPIR